MTFTPEQLQERTLHRRAIEAAIWGIPAVNYEMLFQALVRDAEGAPNQIVYWSRLLDGKNQTLTPNPDAIYLMPFYDTTSGPVVLEIPPADDGSITGSIDDAWQCAIADVGPAGTDAGKGGKYLILPPDHDGDVPAGYLRCPPRPTAATHCCGQTSRVAATPTSRRPSPTASGSSSTPLTTRMLRPPSSTPPASCSTTIRYDATFFDALDRRVQAEPLLTRDKAMIDTLKTIGIEKGHPFAPATATTNTLTDAMTEAHAWLDVRYQAVFDTTFYDDAKWAFPGSRDLVEASESGFSNPDIYPIDDRGVTYSWAFFSAKKMGAGQYYLMTIQDEDGKPFDGARHTDSGYPPRCPSRCTGRPRCTTAPRTPSSRTCPEPVARRTVPACTPRTTDRSSSTSDTNLPTGTTRTGSRPARTATSRCSAAFTGPRSPSSTKRGHFPTSNGFIEPSATANRIPISRTRS